MVDLSPQQMKILERLFVAGFRPIAIPPYESALCLRRGDCVGILSPVKDTGFQLMAPPSYLVDGKIGVKLKRASGAVFAWKGKEIAANAERLAELELFRSELTELLNTPFVQ